MARTSNVSSCKPALYAQSGPQYIACDSCPAPAHTACLIYCNCALYIWQGQACSPGYSQKYMPEHEHIAARVRYHDHLG